MTAWVTIVYGILMLLGGAVVNVLITVWVFRWKQRQMVPDDLTFRMTRLEQAFVAHTGVTLNGKDYTKERT